MSALSCSGALSPPTPLFAIRHFFAVHGGIANQSSLRHSNYGHILIDYAYTFLQGRTVFSFLFLLTREVEEN